MTARVVFVIALAAVGAVLFVLPHHRRAPHGNTLRETLSDLLESEPEPAPRVLVVKFLAAVGCVAVFLPSVLALLAMLVPAEARRTVLILGGITLVIAASLTFLVEVVSDLHFGFGGGASHSETPVFLLAPLWPAACGTAAIVAGAMNWPIP
jgi:hypothetical protein